MTKFIITFGQAHVHHINDKIFDHNCVAGITANSHGEAREIAFAAFGPKFCTSHSLESYLEENMAKYYPRGIIDLN